MAASNELEIVIRARDAASATLKQIRGELDQTARSVTSSIGQTFKDNYKAAGVASGALLGVLALGTKAALDQASAYQQNRVAFDVMLGSADKARVLLKQLSDFANQTPFLLPDVVQGARNLLAFGVSAQDIIPTFRMLGNIASAVGTENLPNIVRVFGQIRVAGRAMSQDINQLTQAGVPIIDELAAHWHKSSKQVVQDIQSGITPSFDDINAALQQLGGPSGKWGDLMAKQSKTFGGTLSNVSDQLGRLLRQAVGIGPDGDIRQGSLFDVLTKGANTLLAALNSVAPYIEAVTGFFERNQVAAVALFGALGGLAILAGVALVSAFGGALVVMGTFAAVGAGIAALAFVIMSNWSNITKFFADLWNGITTTVGAGLDWLKNNWASALGFIIGFVATLPIKLPFLMYDALVGMANMVVRVNWGAVAGVIGGAFSGMWNGVKDAATATWRFITGINWGSLTIGIGKSIGNVIIDMVQGALNGALAGIPGKPQVHLPHFAQGVQNFGGGWAVVGERGPELAYLPKGANVYSNQDSQHMAPGGVTINQTNHIYNPFDLEAANRELGWRFSNA